MTTAARRAPLLFAVAAAALALDQLSKAWVVASLEGRPPIRVIPGVLSFAYTSNSGGAFGLGRSAPWIFAGATMLVSGAIVVISRRPMGRATAIALGMILGGALGNLADRALNGPGLRGEVTDFIDLQIWPVFNLADSFIVVGALVLAFSSFAHDGADQDAADRRS
ncbi:MAG TPA: signal peptidase II [Actinomycetota bacterium]|nr:signal peptidase II [Actinomycetota bacterium]